jgi:hypothetical protein
VHVRTREVKAQVPHVNFRDDDRCAATTPRTEHGATGAPVSRYASIALTAIRRPRDE